MKYAKYTRTEIPFGWNEVKVESGRISRYGEILREGIAIAIVTAGTYRNFQLRVFYGT